MMQSVKDIFSKKYVQLISIALVVVVLGGLYFLRNGNGTEEVFVAKRGDFLQEVSVSGKVISAESVDLAFNQTGRVSGVFAKVGDIIPQGIVLASIENGDARADILQKEASLETEKAILADLKRGTRPEELAISEAKVIAANVDLTDAQESLKEKISDAYVKSDDAVRTKADQFFSNPKSPNPGLIFETDGQLRQELFALRVQLEGSLTEWNTAIGGGTVLSKLAASSLERAAEVKVFLEKAALALSSLQASSSLSQSKIDGWKTDISGARTAVSTAQGALVSAVGDVSSAEAALSLAEKELALEKAGVTAEDVNAEVARVKAAEADLLSARARYQKTLVVAPFSGIVSKMDAKVGGIASANASVISMISTNAYQIESFMPEINTPLVEVEDRAAVTLDAYGTDIIFKAKVISIDPAETIRDGVSTYRAKLVFLENDVRIKPGMTANIVITTEQKVNVIAIPQGVIVRRGNQKIVYVKEGESFVERTVETGSVSSLGEAEIVSGLSEGDAILLNPGM